MKQLENHCVDCGLPCMGNTCQYRNVVVFYCDQCGEENAGYRIDGVDLCGDCAESHLASAFQDLTLSEKAEALHIDIHDL